MPQTHFWSVKATQNKSDATNRFGVRDFVSAVFTCFIRECARFEVIRDFRSLKNCKNPSRHRRTKVTSPIDSATATSYYLYVYMFSRQFRPFRGYSRFAFVKEWQNFISGRWKHRRKNVTSPFNSWLAV
jgi:hypothetical protein